MEKSAIIIAGKSSSLHSKDKALIELNNKPLIKHVFDAIKTIPEEIIIVTDSKEKQSIYQKILPSKAKFAFNENELKGPLTDALAGLKSAQGKYSLLLPYDAPFVSKEVVSLLFDCCIGKTAAIPRWSFNEIEPLQAVYQTQLVLKTANEAIKAGEADLAVMVDRLRGVRYISSLVFEQIDPEMRSFFRIDNPQALKKAELMLTQRKAKLERKK